MHFKKVKYWAKRACDWFQLEGFLILKSSEKHYHVVFNCPVIWRKNIHIMNWVAIESQSIKMKDYALMQGIKESSTLRIGPKRDKNAQQSFIKLELKIKKFPIF